MVFLIGLRISANKTGSSAFCSEGASAVTPAQVALNPASGVWFPLAHRGASTAGHSPISAVEVRPAGQEKRGDRSCSSSVSAGCMIPGNRLSCPPNIKGSGGDS